MYGVVLLGEARQGMIPGGGQAGDDPGGGQAGDDPRQVMCRATHAQREREMVMLLTVTMLVRAVMGSDVSEVRLVGWWVTAAGGR